MTSNPQRRLFAGLPTGAPPAKALPAPDTIALLLGRTSFGVRADDLARAAGMGFDAWLREQLELDAAIDTTALDAELAAAYPTLALAVPALAAYARNNNSTVPLNELLGATLSRQLRSPRQLYEVMVEFWSNHFSVYHRDGNVRVMKTFDDRAAIRPHAFGRFRDLLHASARSPAMLLFLDNYTNVKDGPNENYARELMELHTLGVGGGYSEDDIKNVARCFTGWTVDAAAADGFGFKAATHDTGAKSVLGRAIPARAAADGLQDGIDVLDLLAAHPSTATFVCSKLLRRFVGDVPDAALVTQLAATFTATDGDIRAVLMVLFSSPQFRASADAKTKRPLELLLSAVRATGATLDGNYAALLVNQANGLAQLPFGWPAPNGYPDVAGYWINASALLKRWNVGFALAEGRFAPRIAVDLDALAGDADTVTALVTQLESRVLCRAITAEDRDTLIAFATHANPASADTPLSPSQRTAATRSLLDALLASDYFQYR